MTERSIRLRLESDSPLGSRETFIITVGDDGAEIRRENEPVVTRDRSIATTVGDEPTYVGVVLHVEEAAC